MIKYTSKPAARVRNESLIISVVVMNSFLLLCVTYEKSHFICDFKTRKLSTKKLSGLLSVKSDVFEGGAGVCVKATVKDGGR